MLFRNREIPCTTFAIVTIGDGDGRPDKINPIYLFIYFTDDALRFPRFNLSAKHQDTRLLLD